MNNIFKKYWFWVSIAGIVVIGSALYFQSSDKNIIDNDSVAVRVNDTVFTYEEFENTSQQLVQEFEMYGMEATEEEIKEEVIQRLIQQALLGQHVAEKDLQVSQEELNQQVNEIMAMLGVQNEEELLEQLKMQGIESMGEFKDLLTFEIGINKLIDLYSKDIDISEEQLKEFYDDYAQQMEELEQDVLLFEELKEDIRRELAYEEVTAILLSKIEELKEKAEIEIFID